MGCFPFLSSTAFTRANRWHPIMQQLKHSRSNSNTHASSGDKRVAESDAKELQKVTVNGWITRRRGKRAI